MRGFLSKDLGIPIDICGLIEKFSGNPATKRLQEVQKRLMHIELKHFSRTDIYIYNTYNGIDLLKRIKKLSPYINKKIYNNDLKRLLRESNLFEHLEKVASSYGGELSYSDRKDKRYMVSFRGKKIHFCPNNEINYVDMNEIEKEKLYLKRYYTRLSNDGYPAIYDQYNQIYWMKNVVFQII